MKMAAEAALRIEKPRRGHAGLQQPFRHRHAGGRQGSAVYQAAANAAHDPAKRDADIAEGPSLPGIENFVTQIFAAACPRAKHERQSVALFEIVLEQETADGGVAA